MEEKDKNVITRYVQLYDYIISEYYNHSVELNSEYFDIQVDMRKRDILRAYKKLQYDINGDAVVQLKSEVIFDENKIAGINLTFAKDKQYSQRYKGNCKDFLEDIMNNESKHHFYRLMDEERNGNIIGGIKLDFIC